MEIKHIEKRKHDFPSVEAPLILKTPERLQAEELGYGLAMSSDEKLCALLETMQLSPTEISLKMGWPLEWIVPIRQKREYREMVRRCIGIKAAKDCEGVEIEELFNNQVRPSARTLIEVRDNPFEKAGDRIKASVEFLDRAKEAPKTQRVQEERGVVLHLPVGELRNMQQALLEQGTKEDLEIAGLIEGEIVEVGDGQGD